MQSYQESRRSVISKTPIWSFFLRKTSGESAKCKMCDRILKTSGSNTSGLHRHMMGKHPEIDTKIPSKIQGTSPVRKYFSPTKRKSSPGSPEKEDTGPSLKQVKKEYEESTSVQEYTSPTAGDCNKSTPTTIDCFVIDMDSIEVVLSRMTSFDGFPLGIFITSSDVRSLMTGCGLDLPKSTRAIRDLVAKHARYVRQTYQDDLLRLKAKGERISLKFQEWTAIKNRHYLNISARVSNRSFDLGLVRVRESLSGEDYVKLLREKLASFGLNLHEDVFCVTTDNAFMIQKLGRLLPCEWQFCFAHAIHLAVVDALYKKPKPKFASEYRNDDTDSDFDDEDEDRWFEVVRESDELLELADFVSPLVQKVRAAVKLFRKSTTRNSILQKNVVDQCGKEIQLVLNGAGWDGLFLMLQQFYYLKHSVLKSLIDLGSPITFREEDFYLIHNLVETLEPIKLAVEALCRSDATLLSADTTISFMMNNMGNSDFALQLEDSLALRINQCRTRVSSLLQFLHKGKQDGAELNLNPRLNFEHLDKATIVSMIANTLKSFKKRDSVCEPELHFETVQVDDLNMSLQEKLNRAIEHELNSKITPKVSMDVTYTVKKEIANFEFELQRGEHLEICYEKLKSIPPASADPDKVFSACEKTKTKIRSTLNDETLDTLILLRSYFKHEKKKNNS